MKEVIVRTSFNGDEEKQQWRDGKSIEFVVRCKDCKHWKTVTNGHWENEPCCEWAGWLVGANGYCVYGERKDGSE